MNSNGASWNMDFVTTTGNVVLDLLHNFHLECGARLHKLRVYETLTDPPGREVCGYLLVRGSVHAHAYALAIKKITGVEIEKMLPTPNINLDRIPECQKYLAEGSHRRLYRFSPEDYKEMAGIWGNGETGSAGRPAGRTRGRGRVSRRAARSTTWPASPRPSRRTMRPRKCSRSPRSCTRSLARAPELGRQVAADCSELATVATRSYTTMLWSTDWPTIASYPLSARSISITYIPRARLPISPAIPPVPSVSPSSRSTIARQIADRSQGRLPNRPLNWSVGQSSGVRGNRHFPLVPKPVPSYRRSV